MITAAPRRLRLPVGGVALPLLVFVGAFLLLLAVGRAARPPETTVLVAARDLRAGTPLEAKDLVTLAVVLDPALQETVVPAARQAEVVGRILTRPVPKGRPIPADAVVAPPRLPALVPEGFVLQALPLGRQNVIAPPVAFFRPGDRIALTVVTTPAQTPGPGGRPIASGSLAKTLVPEGLPILDVLPDDKGLLLLLVPADRAELVSLAIAQAQALVVTIPRPLPEGAPPPRTPGGVFEDLTAQFQADRQALQAAAGQGQPAPNPQGGRP